MTALDMTESIAPKSDQLNSEDLLAGERTVTITEVRKGSAEQPFDFHLAEFPGRPFKPSKTVRRILVHAWGKDASTYAGRRMTIYRDPKVKWAGQEVGGIRVSHLSHIDKPFQLALAVTKSAREKYEIRPLAEIPDYLEQARAATDVDEVKAIWQRAKSAGHLDDALNAALKPIGEALKTRPAPETATLPGTENDQ